MKHIICIFIVIATLLFTNTVFAQQDTLKDNNKQDSTKGKTHPTTLSLGAKGFRLTRESKAKNREEMEEEDEQGDFETHWGIFDLGINTIQDNTNYNSPAVKTFLNVPSNRQNSSLFNLRQGKSINVNIYPWMETLYALKTKHQQINISIGLGFQLYNFRYENPITYTRNPNSVILDTVSFKKDKLAFDYLNAPLMFTFKTKLNKKEWLVYGVGITAGYSIATWTKQESGPRGKVKVHDDFDFSNFNSCFTAEFGVTGIRFYGAYQLTNMYNNSAFNMHPITFGIRFFAI